MRAAVFLDRDGTILVERGGPPLAPEDVSLEHGAADGLRALAAAGFALVVVTNQSGLARGLYDETTYAAVTDRLTSLLDAEDVRLDAIEHCPHHPEGAVAAWTGPCDCRKPAPGLILRAAERLGLDLEASWCVGDAARDVEAGRAAGCRTVLVLTGKGGRERPAAEALGARVAADLAAAAREIVEQAS